MIRLNNCIGVLNNIFSNTNEPTGFINTTDSTISFSNSSPDRTLTIAPSSSSFSFYVKGKLFTKTSSETIQITNTEGVHYVYYNNLGVLTSTTTFASSIITSNALVAIVYWDVSESKQLYVSDERHGATMDGVTHAYLHLTQGTKWITGLALGNFNADGTGNDNSNAQFSVSDGMIMDEDLSIQISDNDPQYLSNIAKIPVFYKSGGEGLWNKDTATNYAVKPYDPGTSGDYRLAYNQFTGATWTQTEVGNLQFVLAHIFATNDIYEPIVAIQGQSTYTSVLNARNGAKVEMNNIITTGLPIVEFVPIASVIFQTATAYSNEVLARIRTTDEGNDYVDFREFKLASTGSVNNHGNLSELTDDDHTQYLLLAGRSGGQVAIGGIDASDGLTLISTSNATKGLITAGSTLYINEVNNRAGININSPDSTCHIEQSSTTGAIPALHLDQKDIDQAFIKFSGGTVYTGKTAQDEYLQVIDPSGNTRYIRLHS